MDTFETITFEIDGPVATITLNRPDARNAMSNQMVDELLGCFTTLRGEEYVGLRVVVLRAAGSAFCAGGDVRDLANTRPAVESHAATARLDELLRAVNEAPQVVVAGVQGAALGGGLGLVCVTDIAVAGESASFGFTEARLGLAPAVISPYILARVGLTRARQLVLTASRVDARAAVAYGLVHEACPDTELDARVEVVVGEVLQCAPGALRECKRLLFHVASHPDTLDYRVDLLHRLRAGAEAQQGMHAFVTKRPAPWVPHS